MSNDIRTVIKEMRARTINNGKPSQTLHAWADRLEAALEPTYFNFEAVHGTDKLKAFPLYKPRSPLYNYLSQSQNDELRELRIAAALLNSPFKEDYGTSDTPNCS